MYLSLILSQPDLAQIIGCTLAQGRCQRRADGARSARERAHHSLQRLLHAKDALYGSGLPKKAASVTRLLVREPARRF